MAGLHIRKRYYLSVPILAVLVMFTIIVLPYRHTAAPGQKSTPSTDTVQQTVDRPSEAAIPDNYTSTAVGDEPKYIHLPSIDSAGYIIKVGIDQRNQIASPNNVNLAGWYTNSLKPGQAGLSIIDGHVDGKTGPGIFLRLAKLEPGDTYTVDLANDAKLTYQVRRVTMLKVADVPAVLFAQDPAIASQLNLITCYGNFNYQSAQYDQRTIVVSELVNQPHN